MILNNIERKHSKASVHPFDEVKWVTGLAEIKDIKNPDNSYRCDHVEFPDYFNQNSINITASKYFYKDYIVDGKVVSPAEYSFRQPIQRIVNINTKWAIEQGYFPTRGYAPETGRSLFVQTLNEQDANVVYHRKYLFTDDPACIYADELTYMILHQMFAHNSPVWFNVGNPNRHGKFQISACFILSAEDTMESIADNYKIESDIFRYGSGAGSNRSNLRSSKERLSGGGSPSGPNSFMRVYDSIAKATKSGGNTRRSAKLEILDDDHGDIKEFIWQKHKEEGKAKALIAAGYDGRYDSIDGAYATVCFQQSNQSVSASDAFLEAVASNQVWNTRTRKTKEIIESMPAKSLMKEISECTWVSGDPGLFFKDTINKWHTCANDGSIRGANPCIEYNFIDDTSCNLASFNLLKFLREDGSFDYELFSHSAMIGTTSLDVWIDNAHYPTEKIAQMTKKYRTLGLGYANLGALLVAMGIAYDSKEGRDIAAVITALLHASAYKQSADLAEVVGAFERFEANKEPMCNVISMHHTKVMELRDDIGRGKDWLTEAIYIAQGLIGFEVGTEFRNAQVTVMAPTGTIAFVMGCDTTGVEPMAFLVGYKQLAGGGQLKLVADVVMRGLKTLGYTETGIKVITDAILEGKSLKEMYQFNPKDLPVFATAIDPENTISWRGHVDMMAAIQPYLSGAISKTVNCPNSTTAEEIEDIYMYAWTQGVKAIAIYRDGCKSSQPLNVKSEEKKEVSMPAEDKLSLPEVKPIPKTSTEEVRITPVRRKMPNDRAAMVHKFEIGGHKGLIKTGFYPDDGVGEVFVEIGKEGSTISGLLNGWSKDISYMLQFGIPFDFIYHKYTDMRFEPAGMTSNKDIRFCTSIFDYVVRYLKINFFSDDKTRVLIKPQIITESPIQLNVLEDSKKPTSKDAVICNKCGGMAYRAGTCHVCSSCGETSGCG